MTAAITFLDASEEQYPILGEDYTVRCKVKAMPPPTIDWFRNGQQIKTNDHYVIESYGLKIRKAQESDTDIYTCRASVTMTGEYQSKNIRVEVRTHD